MFVNLGGSVEAHIKGLSRYEEFVNLRRVCQVIGVVKLYVGL